MLADGLTPTLARSVADRDGRLLLTFCNHARLDFAATWAAHVVALGVHNWLVGATDSKTLRGLRRAKIPSFAMRTDLPETEWAWGSENFKRLGPHKIELVYRALGWGLEVIVTDVDALVLRDPWPFMARWPDAAFLTTTDHLSSTSIGGGPPAAATPLHPVGST